MIANRTTLILGAGASFPAYPVGSGLRDKIIDLTGNDGISLFGSRRTLAKRFRHSLIPSIDAFLAQPENKDLLDAGKIAIAAALLPCERTNLPSWYQLLFNAIRGRPDEQRKYRIQIVTFNYDLSLEWAMYLAFSATYGVAGEEAKRLMDESVDIIHVYGQLGTIEIPHGMRSYGAEVNDDTVVSAAQAIKIIGRDPDSPLFKRAHDAIANAHFLAILGFGFDETNVANLKLPELTTGKVVFSTGYNMGYGMRGWLRHIGLHEMFIAPFSHDVETFLTRSAFLHWANLPGMTGKAMCNAIYQERDAAAFHLPD